MRLQCCATGVLACKLASPPNTRFKLTFAFNISTTFPKHEIVPDSIFNSILLFKISVVCFILVSCPDLQKWQLWACDCDIHVCKTFSMLLSSSCRYYCTWRSSSCKAVTHMSILRQIRSLALCSETYILFVACKSYFQDTIGFIVGHQWDSKRNSINKKWNIKILYFCNMHVAPKWNTWQHMRQFGSVMVLYQLEYSRDHLTERE